MPRQLHTATTAATIPAAVLRPNPVVLRRIGRVLGSELARDPLGTPGERQHDRERGKPSRPVHRLPPMHPICEPKTHEHCIEVNYLQRTRFESIAERKLRRRQLTEDGNVEISGRDLREGAGSKHGLFWRRAVQ